MMITALKQNPGNPLVLVSLVLLVFTFFEPSKTFDFGDHPFTNPQQSLQKLCNKERVALTKISEVLSVIEELKKTIYVEIKESSCPIEVRQAIQEAGKVIEENEDVCSREKTDLIYNFHLRYISSEQRDNLRKHLPKSLKIFMIGYGLRVSSICKRNMINNLISDTHALLGEHDFQLMNSFTDDKQGILSKMNGKPQDFDDILLASDLLNMKQDLDDGKKEDGNQVNEYEKIFVKAKTGPAVRKMKLACQNRYKPFYEKLILPLVRLADVGYNYKGEDMAKELAEIKSNPEIGKWYSLVYFCEILLTVEVVENESSSKLDKSVANDEQIVDILSVDEAKEMRRVLTRITSQDIVPKGLEKVEYSLKDKNIPLDDLILNKEDGNFSSQVDKFDTSLSVFHRIRHQFFSKTCKVIKEYIASGKLNIRSTFLSSKQRSEHTADEQRGELIGAIDEYIEDSEQSAHDEPVAGLKKKYALKHSDGQIEYMEKASTPWWKLNRQKISKFVGCLLIVAIFITIFVLFTMLA